MSQKKKQEVSEPIQIESSAKSRKKRNTYKLFPVRLPEKLLQIRKKNHLRQDQMLAIINPNEPIENRARISQYENGMRIPSLIEVYNYAQFAKVSMEILVNDELDLP